MQYEIKITGLVQGVGFRPFIYKLATDMNLHGFVENNTAGVRIEVQCSKNEVDAFITRIMSELPQVANIASLESSLSTSNTSFHCFSIAPSTQLDAEITRISPDIAICEECMCDYQSQPHRINYPFVNCTNCGPRFSIIQSIPYDRTYTTMAEFEMCDTCKAEYENPNDRRFHAQPVACNHCGPYYTAFKKQESITNYQEIVHQMAATLRSGGVVALKGVGGFNWIVDAENDEAVMHLREIKRRYIKPFAIMCANQQWLDERVEITPAEAEILNSWRRPILLLNEKKKISTHLNGGLKTIGVMQPYLPLHYELFKHSRLNALVVTSANRSGEPMLRDNEPAKAYLIDNSDLYVEHNREIYNRVDDSVVRMINDKPQLLRRARGYTPEPIINCDEVEGGIAFGAEMTAIFALGKGDQILMSQYIGDLSDYEVYEAYKDTLSCLIALFKVKPTYLVCDNHPQYFSSKLAQQWALEKDLPLYFIQHHHAHAVAVMVEYNLTTPCIALSMDGVGYGDDGESWGGEVLLCDRMQYQRLSHLPYVSMPGADKAAKEGWRMALSYLYDLDATLSVVPDHLVHNLGAKKIEQLHRLLQSPLNRYKTSSAGRLFDAVASLTDICQVNSFQAEAAMKLEHAAYEYSEDRSTYVCHSADELDVRAIISGVIADMANHVEAGRVAMRFHRTLAKELSLLLMRYAKECDINNILLTGGVFQNRLLSELLINRMKSHKEFTLYYPSLIPCNDGGIAVGQLAIAAALRKQQ